MTDKISISKWLNDESEQLVSVKIQNNQGKVLYVGDMTLCEFAACVTGGANREITRSEAT